MVSESLSFGGASNLGAGGCKAGRSGMSREHPGLRMVFLCNVSPVSMHISQTKADVLECEDL